MKNTCPFYIVFQVLKVLLVKIWVPKFVRCSHQMYYFLLFLLAFTSADIIFHKCLEPYSTFSEKKRFFEKIRREFSLFLTDLRKPPTLLTVKIR